jgi:uncharacterized protein YcbX
VQTAPNGAPSVPAGIQGGRRGEAVRGRRRGESADFDRDRVAGRSGGVNARLARVRIYPFKSLAGIDVRSATIVAGGALAHDREFAIFDERGDCVNAKREPRIYDLRVAYDDELTSVRFESASLRETFTFDFDDETRALETWLGRHFERPVVVKRRPDGGFPDDSRSPGPTILSTATLDVVAGWFPGLDAASVRGRLRANLEIEGLVPFGEDALFAGEGELLDFRIGALTFQGTNPTARCPVPSRDPVTGEPISTFAKTVSLRREETLPEFAERSRFDHFYRLAVNTRASLSEIGKQVTVGDPVEVPAHSVEWNASATARG